MFALRMCVWVCVCVCCVCYVVLVIKAILKFEGVRVPRYLLLLFNPFLMLQLASILLTEFTEF